MRSRRPRQGGSVFGRRRRRRGRSARRAGGIWWGVMMCFHMADCMGWLLNCLPRRHTLMLTTRLVELKGDVLGSLEVGALWSRRSAFVLPISHVELMAARIVMIV